MAVGHYASNSKSDVLLFRTTASGDLDLDFGSRGLVTTSGPERERPQAIAVQSDDKILVVGAAIEAELLQEQIGFIARYNEDGSLDETFGDGGRSEGSRVSNESTSYREILVQPDGKIVIAGYVEPDFPFSGTGRKILLERYEASGDLDPNFGVGGRVILNSTFNAIALQAALQPNGNILTSGSSDDGLTLARFHTDGSVDTSFGIDGFVREPSFALGRVLLVDPSGDIVVVGGGVFALRFHASGELDTGFGVDGVASFSQAFLGSIANAFILPGGKVVVTGDYNQFLGFGPYLVRFDANGDLDLTYGDNGFATPGFPPFTSMSVGAAALQPDGRVVFVGNQEILRPENLSVARVLGDCGNGVVDAGEQCDDGGIAGFDCCDSACQYEVAGSFCDSDGSLCSTDSCDGIGGCNFIGVEPASTCRAPIQVGKASLSIKGTPVDEADRLDWKWNKGAATSVEAMGDPTVATDNALCVYGESGAFANLLTELRAPAGGSCGGKPCWKARGSRPLGSKGFTYKDRDRTRDGIDTFEIKPGADGRAKVNVKAKGPNIPLAV